MKDTTILFLDIDGVLNSDEHDAKQPGGLPGGEPGLWEEPSKGTLRWCPMMVARVRRIVARSDCHIVMSTSWRGYPTEHASWKWKQMFAVYGWTDAPVIGETPPGKPRKFSQYLNGEQSFRGDEIAAWLKQHGPVRAYVCLDDHANFHPKQPLVQTDPRVGLQDEQVERCIEILNKDRAA